MSGIAAIIHFDGQPAAAARISRVTADMAYRGPDGIAHHVAGPVSLGQCHFHTTAPEAALPLPNADQSAVLVWDGYLTHPDELHAELLAHGHCPRDRSDAELVLQAWECWGTDCPHHIDGEYAFIVWDSRRRAAFLARDHQGLRPLLYHWDGTTLVAASDIGAVLAGMERQPEPDRSTLAEYMGMRFHSPDRTVWQGVQRVKAASWIMVDGRGQRGETYWSPPRQVTILYRTDADYIAHYRDLLEDCVRRAARSHRPVAIEASGGLDSSAVLALAHRLDQRGALPAPGFRAYTLSAPAGTDADESAYVEALSRHLGVPIAGSPLFLPDDDWFRRETIRTRDLAAYPNMAMTITMEQAMAADGCRVALSGQGGDHWLWGNDFAYLEMIGSGDWVALRRQLALDAASLGRAEALRRMVRFGLVPMLPDWLRRAYRLATGREGNVRAQGYYWLAPDLRAEMLAKDRDWAQRVLSAYHRHYKQEKWSQPFIQRVTESFTRQKAVNQIEPRNPMFSRAFIEYSARTPEHLRKRGATHKFIHRQAMAGLLPDAIAQRTSKAEFSITSERYRNLLEHAMTVDIPASGQGLTDPAGLARLWSSFCNAAIDEQSYWELWGNYVCYLLVAILRDDQDRSFNHGPQV